MSRLVVPPALDVEQRAELKAAVQELPSQSGIGASNYNWKSVCQFVRDRFGLALSRSPPQADLNYLHRLGFVLKRPRKRLLKADPARREALVGSTSLRRGEKVSYYSAVCLEAEEVEVMELEGNSNCGGTTPNRSS